MHSYIAAGLCFMLNKIYIDRHNYIILNMDNKFNGFLATHTVSSISKSQFMISRSYSLSAIFIQVKQHSNTLFQFKLQQLQVCSSNMDQRLYHYEYRRPRHSNPTYSSYNVNNSMTFFMGGSNNPNRSSAYDRQFRPMQQTTHNYPKRSESEIHQESGRERTRSHLSSYGTSSLAFNQRDIYNKQNSKFNIISLKPKGVDDQIKVYPKLTLEDKDSLYYQKMNTMRQQEESLSKMRKSQIYPNPRGPDLAGKHTFAPEDGKNPNYYQHGRYFTPRMLNHADEVGNIM